MNITTNLIGIRLDNHFSDLLSLLKYNTFNKDKKR